jgi:hypothetical protein
MQLKQNSSSQRLERQRDRERILFGTQGDGLASSSRRLVIGRHCGAHRATRSASQCAPTAAALLATGIRRGSTKLNLLKLIGTQSSGRGTGLCGLGRNHCLGP